MPMKTLGLGLRLRLGLGLGLREIVNPLCLESSTEGGKRGSRLPFCQPRVCFTPYMNTL